MNGVKRKELTTAEGAFVVEAIRLDVLKTKGNCGGRRRWVSPLGDWEGRSVALGEGSTTRKKGTVGFYESAAFIIPP